MELVVYRVFNIKLHVYMPNQCQERLNWSKWVLCHERGNWIFLMQSSRIDEIYCRPFDSYGYIYEFNVINICMMDHD